MSPSSVEIMRSLDFESGDSEAMVESRGGEEMAQRRGHEDQSRP